VVEDRKVAPSIERSEDIIRMEQAFAHWAVKGTESKSNIDRLLQNKDFISPLKKLGWKGFLFGTGMDCDVLLGDAEEGNKSECYFEITFDEEERLVLIDRGKGTAVSYNGEREFQRRNFKWILFPDRKIKVHLSFGFYLDIILAKHENCEAQYKARVAQYLKTSRANISLPSPHWAAAVPTNNYDSLVTSVYDSIIQKSLHLSSSVSININPT
jgi:hypothetical protein